MAGNNSEQGRGVASKVAALLEAFLPSSHELSLNELSARAGLPLSTAYRLASQLVEWGGLERGQNGGYRLGMRLWEIGQLAGDTRSCLNVITPYMQDLHDVVHENVQLAVRNGLQVMYLEKLAGSTATPTRVRRGGRLPLHATGVGKVLLAYAPSPVAERLLRHGLRRYTPYTVTSHARLQRELNEVRRTGVAFARDELTMGVTSAAAPVRDASGEVVAAISVCCRSLRLRQHHVVAIRTAATSATRQLRELGLLLNISAAEFESSGTEG